MFWTPSTEEESVDLEFDLSKTVFSSTEPSSPTESDESEESKTIQNSPEQLPSIHSLWESKPSVSSFTTTPVINSNHIGISTTVPQPCVTSMNTPYASTTTGNRNLTPEMNIPRSGIMPELLPNYQAQLNTFPSQNMDAVSQYLLNQYLYQQLIALSRVNSMNGAASLNSMPANMGRNMMYNPLAQMPMVSVPFTPQIQMPFQFSLPFQYPFFPMPVDMSMVDQTQLTQTTVNSSPTKSNDLTKSDNTDASKSSPETPKKRRAPSKRTSRKVRPKVIPEKGAIQCQGTNRKKNKRCRNAALMEYIGPRPIYCAEHIHLDPECLYTKCKSTYQKVPGDKKGCREVVLKEFNLCHKHYHDAVKKMKGVEGSSHVLDKLVRVSEILNNLEDEALKAKKTDADLFQRKNKLIPKFHQIRAILKKRLCELNTEGLPMQKAIPSEYFQDPDSIIPLSILQTAYQPTFSPEPALDKTLEL